MILTTHYRGNARSGTCQRGCTLPGLLLLGVFYALMTGLVHPTQAALTEAWVQRYNGPTNLNDYATAVAVDGNGNVAVTGFSASEGIQDNPNYDYYTAKYAAANGALIWEKRYNGPANYSDQANAVAVDGSGNVVVTGFSAGGFDVGGIPNYDYYTAKYAAADGALLWEKRYDGPANYDDKAQAVAVDASGNVVVTGSSSRSGGNSYDFCTAKYAAADGNLIWEQRYNGPANADDHAYAVATDSSGNVVVVGYSFNCACFFDADYYTAKYAAADGALLWEIRFIGPGSLLFDVAMFQMVAVAVDASGNVVVTGSSAGDYYTAKIAAADGVLLWEKRYNGSHGYGFAGAVAVDNSGNVVVTGSSYNGTNSDYYTAKYAAADGTLLWEKRYNGPANSSDFARAMAIDGSGNVFVTGTSYNTSFTNADYYTAKYAATDGVLLWEKRYHGPANGYDYASSLAHGPNWMVAVTGSSGGDYATVVYWENLPPVGIAVFPDGIRLCFTGVTGRSYNIERAPAVIGPWSTLATPTAPITGLIEYMDTNAPVDTAFYRTSAP